MSISKYIKSIALGLLLLFLLTIIVTLFSYLNIIDKNTIIFFKLTILIISLFVSGLYIGKRASKRKFIEGLKVSFIMICISFIISLITKANIKLTIIIYYLIIIASTTLGSMIVNNNIQKEK